jgi:hypothetical protein
MLLQEAMQQVSVTFSKTLGKWVLYDYLKISQVLTIRTQL